ncbi:MAG: hypothetical protein V4478_01020 [Patescibacteria group bacterium]
MEHTNTTEKILSAIEDKQITPLPKWYFTARNSALWLPGIVTTLLGAYTIAGVLYGILHAEWDNGIYIEHGNPLFLIAAIPLLWVISFGVFCVMSTTLLRKTSSGYRHTTLQLLLVSVASSILIGLLFYTITQNEDDNKVKTYYRYPTQHQREYFNIIFPKPAERNPASLRMN